MKYKAIILLTIIALILTILFADIFSIYHIGSIPTFLTILYLVSIFSLFEYLLITISYIIKKVIKKEKLTLKKISSLILIFIALLLTLIFLIVLDTDYLNWYANSSPFYLNVIIRSFQFILPSIILIIISIVLTKNNSNS